MQLNCRFCDSGLEHVFCDLGSSPLANSYLAAEDLLAMEPRFPLTVYVCSECLLVQLPEFESADAIFSDYAYFSSYSDSWVEHARRYSEAMIERFGFGGDSLVVEIASNDGYLLQHFQAAGVPVLGIEPAANVAAAGEARGIPSRVEFFSDALAGRLVDEGVRPDLLLGNNVFAHVPPLNDFVAGMKRVLAPRGVITLEFPHLARLMAENQFDTIYHEHYSYYSFRVVERILGRHGLTVFDVEELPTHGGSLRVYGRHAEDEERAVGERVAQLRQREEEAGFDRLETYLGFDERVRETKRRFWEFVITAKRAGKTIVGYGAPAKGNTFLNYCGAGTDVLDYTVDRSPAKHGSYLPGTRIPIHTPDRIFETRPDYVLILPWNLRQEITEQMAGIREWGGRFVVAIPETTVLD
jgi:SAM-dependent methyltransferase